MQFTVRFEDIVWPERCPALGTSLEYAAGRGRLDPRVTASFDRIDSSKGYVPGNVQVISLLANVLKYRDTTPAELRSVADWLDSITKGK